MICAGCNAVTEDYIFPSTPICKSCFNKMLTHSKPGWDKVVGSITVQGPPEFLEKCANVFKDGTFRPAT